MTWPAPRAARRLDARVPIPGSKSQTNRALLLAALGDGPSRITAPLIARDTDLMRAALAGLGAGIAATVDGWLVTPGALHGASVDTGLAGTVMRFVPPVAALANGTTELDGDPQARSRPMATLIDALRQSGVDIDDAGTGRLPFAVHGRGGAPGGAVSIDSSASSQFVSALLLAAARYDKGIELRHVAGASVPSLSHIAMTVAALRVRGVEVEDGQPNAWRVWPGNIAAHDEEIEPDLSNAAPFLAAALVAGGTVRIPRWPMITTQPGDAVRELIDALGGSVTFADNELVVHGGSRIAGIDVDLHDVSELTPVIAALAALADSPSRLRGVAHIRGHETDRIAALADNITSLGGDVRQEADGLTIRPRRLTGGVWRSHADHRMAQAGALLGLAVPGVLVEDIATTRKTLPDFPGMWTALVAGSSG